MSHGRYELGINDSKGKMIGRVVGKKEYKITKNSHTIVYSIKGQLTYIDSHAHIARFETEHKHHKNIILRLRGLGFIDVDGVDALGEIIEILERRGVNVYVTGINDSIYPMLLNSKQFLRLKNDKRVFPHTTDALRHLGFKIPKKELVVGM